MATATSELDDIRRQMAEIRRELHQDVREVVLTAEAATDWRRILTMYPWLTVGVGFGAGFAVSYLLVPRRHRVEIVPVPVTEAGVVAQAQEEKAKAKETRKKAGIFAGVWGLVGPLVIRAAQGYALQYFENWMATQQQQQAAAGPPPYPYPPSSGAPRAPQHQPRPGG